MTTIKEMEAQIAALQKQVQFLLEKIGKLPLKADNIMHTEPIQNFGHHSRIQLQRLKTDGCTSLKEWLKVHDTTNLFPGHCVQFTQELPNSIIITEYVFGWKDLQEHHGQRLRYNHSETMYQWAHKICSSEWAVLERSNLRTDTTRGMKK